MRRCSSFGHRCRGRHSSTTQLETIISLVTQFLALLFQYQWKFSMVCMQYILLKPVLLEYYLRLINEAQRSIERARLWRRWIHADSSCPNPYVDEQGQSTQRQIQDSILVGGISTMQVPYIICREVLLFGECVNLCSGNMSTAKQQDKLTDRHTLFVTPSKWHPCI